MALEEMKCPDCDGYGYCYREDDEYPGGLFYDCHRCMGCGELEIQRGPQDADGKVSDSPGAGIPRAVYARWFSQWEG